MRCPRRSRRRGRCRRRQQRRKVRHGTWEAGTEREAVRQRLGNRGTERTCRIGQGNTEKAVGTHQQPQQAQETALGATTTNAREQQTQQQQPHQAPRSLQPQPARQRLEQHQHTMHQTQRHTKSKCHRMLATALPPAHSPHPITPLSTSSPRAARQSRAAADFPPWHHAAHPSKTVSAAQERVTTRRHATR